MSIALSQQEWDALFDRFFEPLAAYRLLRQLFWRFSESRVRLVEHGNLENAASSWRFSSFDLTSLKHDAKLRVRIADEVPGPGQARVGLYRADGGNSADLVAWGQGPDSSTVALAEMNDSGIAGSVDLGVVTADEDDDRHFLVMLPDWRQRAGSVFDGNEPQDRGPENLYGNWIAALERIARNLKTCMDECVSFTRLLLREYVADKIEVRDRQNTGYLASTTQDESSGAVSIALSGLLRELELAMDQTTPAKQAVLERIFPSVAVTPSGTNRGRLQWTSPVFSPGARPGKVSLQAEVGGPTNIGAEEVSFDLKPAAMGGPSQNDASLRASDNARPGGTFRAPRIGLESISPTRAIDKADDSLNVEFGDPQDFSVTGENPENTASGILWLKASGASGSVVVEVYMGSGGAPEDLVAQSPAIGSHGGTFTASEQNQSGLTLVGRIGSNPTGALVKFDLNNLEADSNDGKVPDRWSFQVPSPTVDGQVLETLADAFGPQTRLRKASQASGQVTIPDGRIMRGEDPLLVDAS